jgi:ankyrin repeat protein
MKSLSLYYKFFIIIISSLSLSASEFPSRQSQYALIVEKSQKLNRERSLRSAAEKNNIYEIEIIIQEGKANINAQDKDGNTALYLAASKNNIEAAKILLGHNAKTNIQNNDGNTPLHRVIFTAKNSQLLQLLLNHDADPLIKNKDGYQPDSYLAHTFEGATPSENIDRTKNKFLLSTHNILLHKHLESLEKEIALLNAQLFDAVRCNEVEKLNNLFDKGADVNYQDIWCKDTPLHNAAFYGHLKIIELLLNRCAKVNVKNRKGNTALHIALQRGYFTIASTLLKHETDFTLKDLDGYGADKYFKYLTMHHGDSPIEYENIDNLTRKTILSLHATILSAHLEKMVENDKTIVLKKDTVPSARNS